MWDGCDLVCGGRGERTRMPSDQLTGRDRSPASPRGRTAIRTETEAERLASATAALTDAGIAGPVLGIVLGSGLAGFVKELTGASSVPFSSVPQWPVPRVEGHGAELVVGDLGSTRVACLTGRVHLYEGWSPADVVRPLRTLARLGVEDFVLTNAAGGISEELRPGDLMSISDHVNLTGTSPLLGPHEEVLGPRFPDQSAVYDPELRHLLSVADPELRQGVYGGLLGPSYETPAEVQMLRTCGVDAVGMSTVLEAIALHAMGARVVGISTISNAAAGTSDAKLSHDEVIAAGVAAATRLTTLLRAFGEARIM